PGHGYYWFELATNVEAPAWFAQTLPAVEPPMLVLLEGWRTLFMSKSTPNAIRRAIAGRTREQLQREVLGPYLSKQRWFAAKGHKILKIEIVEDIEWSWGGQSWLLAIVQCEIQGLEPQRYFLPLGIAWEDESEERLRMLAPHTLARVRQRERVGALYSAFGED